MEIIELPPQPNPKRETAHKPITTLGEHAMAFLNANNPKSWAEYQQEEVSGLYSFVGEIMNMRALSEKEIKDINYQLRTGFLKGMGLQKVYDFIATVLGYNGWQDLLTYRSPHGSTINRNFGNTPAEVSAEATATRPSVFVRNVVRIAYLNRYERAFKHLRAGSTGNKSKRIREVMKDLARCLCEGQELPEDWKEQNFLFGTVRDKDDVLKFRLIAVKAGDYEDNMERPTFYAEIKLTPIAQYIDTISDPRPSEKFYPQWREEFFSALPPLNPQKELL